jgi:hypothetical protein
MPLQLHMRLTPAASIILRHVLRKFEFLILSAVDVTYEKKILQHKVMYVL